jgi:hypothetical protein
MTLAVAMTEHLFQYEEQPDNYLKAMKLFFKTRNESINKVVEKRAEEEGDSVEGVMIGFLRYTLNYLGKDRKVPVTVPSEILEKMSPYKTQFIERMMKLMEYSKNGNHDSSGWLKYIEWAEFNL